MFCRMLLKRGRVYEKTAKVICVTIISTIFACFLYWGISIIKCEYLTYKYAQKYVDIVLDGCEPEGLHKIKVLNYNGGYIRIYYVLDYYGTTEPGYGFVAEIANGERIRPDLMDHCVWSNYGSADDYIWPYGR